MARRNIQLAEVSGIVRADAFNALPWYKKLNTDEQGAVLNEGQQLGQSLLQFGRSRLAVGEHLTKLSNILEPHKAFEKFLKHFHFSKRTAYRYIRGYQNAKARLPEAVLRAAMARGVQIVGESETRPLGVYTEAVAALPLPKEATDAQATTYLDQLEAVRKQTRTEIRMPTMFVGDPSMLMKEALRFVSVRYKHLPSAKRTREAWVKQLIGMLLAEFGIHAAQTFAPVIVPETFQVHRGRPKENTLAAVA